MLLVWVQRMLKMIRKVKFLPPEIYKTVLEYAVIPTFDLILEYGKSGIIFVKRTVQPYKNVWSLPGLRMLKTEEVNDTLERIAFWELGLKIDASKKVFLGQYVGKFKTEMNRQDLSTGYYIPVKDTQKIKLNKEHFSNVKISYNLPKPIGAMYKFYFEQYENKRP